MRKKIVFACWLTLAAVVILAACATPTPEVREVEVTRQVQVEVTRVVEVAPQVAYPAEIEALWAASPHGDKTATAFNYWNNASPPEISPTCARCHSTPGYQDYIGADGSEAGKVDKPAPIGTTITCDACHNATAATMTNVVFPSGAEITAIGPEARCMQCHQGRASLVQVNAAIEKAGLTDMDTVSADLGFTNIHYYAAGVSRYGDQVKGGYEYEGKAYDVLFEHVEGYQTCVDCHDPHSLKIKVDECQVCHTGVASQDDLKNVRMQSSQVDYDGDGDLKEGIYYELEGVREKLLQAIMAYGADVSKAAIIYDSHAYPYFFADTNANGQVDEGEAVRDNAYKGWTARLAKAAYNYQTSLKDPGAFAHGGKYIIQLMYDSIEDLNAALPAPVDMTGMHRIDAGHFAGSEYAFRRFDGGGEVSGSCSKCHARDGLRTFIKNGVNVATTPSNGFLCANCHDSVSEFTRYKVNTVRFPSGANVTFGEGAEANLCILCHQGRESTTSMNALMKGIGVDDVSDKLRFLNIHYFAAGATLFGNDAKGAYQYDGQTYLGRNKHVDGFNECVQCHSTHGLQVQVQACSGCHRNVKTEADLVKIRMSPEDYDGDGDTTEGLAGELDTMAEALYAALQKHAADVVGKPIAYESHRHPYYFNDTNANGVADADEAQRDNAYNSWTPRLLKAAYNYQYAQKDPGKFAHNGKYIVQILYDSLKDIGADVSGMTRP